MIDKYKRPRLQRLVPWRSPRTDGAMTMLFHAQREKELAFEGVRREFAQAVVSRMARCVLQSIAAEHALESGALPGELLPKELRVDWG